MHTHTHARACVHTHIHAHEVLAYDCQYYPLLQVLLSTDESLQIAAVQCVKIVLDQCPSFCKELLAADIAG